MKPIALGLCALAMAIFSVSAVVADDGPDFYELIFVAQSDPEAALTQVDSVLDTLVEAKPSQKRLRFDLLRLKADVLIRLNRSDSAAEVVTDLAGIAEADPGLERDPVPLWKEAATLHEAAGDLRSAMDSLRRKLDAQELMEYEIVFLDATRAELKRLADMAGIQLEDNGNAVSSTPMAVGPQLNSALRRGAAPVAEETGYHEVQVYYATDRARDDVTTPATFYGSGRGELELGIATVTIPDSHTPGIVEAPSIWRLEFSANPVKHVVLRSVAPLEERAFYSRLNKEFQDGGKREAFVFIHGYNVLFDQAAKRAAQIAYDLDYPGVPVLYSWPSMGSTIGYVADTAVVRLSGRRLAGFLDDLVDRSGATTIHIVAHSMGNRALTDALEIMTLRRGLNKASDPVFDQILFAAPDVDAGLFVNMIQTIRPIARRLTLYTSEKDWALESSRRLHGNAPRAGQGGGNSLADGNVDSIDMTELGDDMLAHSYFADDRSALADMASLFWRNVAPERRCGLELVGNTSGLPVWRYRQGMCASRGLIDVMAHLRQADVRTIEDARKVLSSSVQDPALFSELSPVIEKLMVE